MVSQNEDLLSQKVDFEMDCSRSNYRLIGAAFGVASLLGDLAEINRQAGDWYRDAVLGYLERYQLLGR